MFSGRIQEQMAELGKSINTCFHARFADGAVCRSRGGKPGFIVVIRYRRANRRIRRTYLMSCAEMFRSPTSGAHLFQIVLSKLNISRDNYPMSRAFLYQ